MNKKQIAALIESMVVKMVEAKGCTEDTARTLVGMSIEANQDALMGVIIPTLSVAVAVAEAA